MILFHGNFRRRGYNVCNALYRNGLRIVNARDGVNAVFFRKFGSVGFHRKAFPGCVLLRKSYRKAKVCTVFHGRLLICADLIALGIAGQRDLVGVDGVYHLNGGIRHHILQTSRLPPWLCLVIALLLRDRRELVCRNAVSVIHIFRAYHRIIRHKLHGIDLIDCDLISDAVSGLICHDNGMRPVIRRNLNTSAGCVCRLPVDSDLFQIFLHHLEGLVAVIRPVVFDAGDYRGCGIQDHSV